MTIGFSKIWLGIVIVFFAISRIILIQTHFTHYDDLYAPYIQSLALNYDQEYLKIQIIKYSSGLIPARVLDVLLAASFLEHPIKILIGALGISISSTYAPIQFLFTGILINFYNSYESFLILSRLPSAVISIFALVLTFYISKKIKDRNLSFFILFSGFLLFATSNMFLIYSVQAQNYAFAPVTVLATILILITYSDREIFFYDSVKIGLLLGLFAFAHYQIVFFYPAFFLALMFHSEKSSSRLKQLFKVIPASVIVVLAISFLYFIFLRPNPNIINPGVNWNAGTDNEFLFVFPDQSFFKNIVYFFKFFIGNSLLVINSIVGFIENITFAKINSSLIILLCYFGFKQLHKSKQGTLISSFIGYLLITWLFLIILQKLTFSPTRHNLALLPVIIILSGAGFAWIYLKIQSILQLKRHIFVSLIALPFLTLYAFNFPSFFESRQDNFQKIDIELLLQKYKIDTIATYGTTMNLQFFPTIKDRYSNIWLNEFPGVDLFQIKESDEYSGKSIMLLCANSDFCGSLENETKTLRLVESNVNQSFQNYQLVYEYSKDSNVTNCFSNIAGSGTNRIFIKILNSL